MKAHPSSANWSLKRWAFVCIIAEIFIALLVLIGWQFNITRLKEPLTGLAGMNPLTAISFLLTGVAFLLLFLKSSPPARTAGKVVAASVVIVSLYKLINYYGNYLPHIDHLLYAKQIIAEQRGILNSMSLTTAGSFALSGIAIILLNKEQRNKKMPSHYLALATMLFAFFSLLGYLYRAPEFATFIEHYPMAVHTAACFVLISLAVLFAHPDKGFTREFTATTTGNLLGNSLLIGAIFIPVVLGLLRIYVSQQKIFSLRLILTFFVLSIIVIFCALIFYFILQVNRLEALRTEAKNKLQQSEKIFRSLVSSIKDYAIFMLDVNGNIITWNRGAEAIKGYQRNEILGKNISIFYTAEDRENNLPSQILKNAKESGTYETEGWRVRKDGSKFWADVVVTALYEDENNLTGYAKITRDITEDKKSKDRLQNFNNELQKEVDNKTRELQQTASQLRQLAAYLQTAREDERKNIAREIHDQLGQMLTGIKMDVVWLRKKMMPVNDEIAKRFEGALELLNETKATMRRISTDLHPAILNDLGLVPALKRLSGEFQSRAGITVTFTSSIEEKDDDNISAATSIGLYRIYQESLTNVAKHADATNINASIKKEDHQLIMDVADDGKGFEVKEIATKKTLGLVSIRERVIMMNGSYTINSSKGKGTHIHVSVPV